MTYYIVNDKQEVMVTLSPAQFERAVEQLTRDAAVAPLDTVEVWIGEAALARLPSSVRARDGFNGLGAKYLADLYRAQQAEVRGALRLTAATKAGTCEACGEVTSHVPHGLFCRS